MPALAACAVPARLATTTAIAAAKMWRVFRMTLRAEFVFMDISPVRLLGVVELMEPGGDKGVRRRRACARRRRIRWAARRPGGRRRPARRDRGARRPPRRWGGARARGTHRRGP